MTRDESLCDPLTRLGNRARLVQAPEDRSRVPRTLLMVDLDDFRALNDTFGYDIGDEVLKGVADQLRRVARPDDVLVRLGGDEFAMLLQGADAAEGRVVADLLLERLDEPLKISGEVVFARASIGIATGDGEDSLQSLMRHASTSIAAAKAATTTDKVVVFDPETYTEIQARRRFVADLRAALGRDEFLLHYQPIVELDTRRTVGFEALLRWRHPTRGEVSPEEFISLAEQDGLMPVLGEWILEEAAREAARWHSRSADSPYVSVNFSVRQFQDHDFIARFERALAASGLPPEKLVVELTETVVAADVAMVSEKLEQLRARGARVYLDDFGTGYSSLSYIRDLPLDGVKLDRAFCQDIVASQDAWALAQAVVSMLDNLQLKITAEGIETAAQLAQLRSLGCDHGQGYYFARPRPADELGEPLPTDSVKVSR